MSCDLCCRTANSSSPELAPLENAHIMKFLSENMSFNPSKPSTDSYTTDNYDKQVNLNNIFDTLLPQPSQKSWQSDQTFLEATPEVRIYVTHFPNTHLHTLI